MLNQQQTPDTTQYVPHAMQAIAPMRSALESRALVALQKVLIVGTQDAYLTHPDFREGFEQGYICEEEVGFYGFGRRKLKLHEVEEIITEYLSFAQLHSDNRDLEGEKPDTYPQRVGFTLGYVRWLFDANRAPAMPLCLLQKWYAIEYLTRKLAARFVSAD